MKTNSTIYQNCRNDPRASVWEHAKLNGIDFRAVGNEPGWLFEISGDMIMFLYNYGTEKYDLNIIETSIDDKAQKTTILAENNSCSVEILLLNKLCQDTMADDEYSTSVTVIFKDQELHGCGKVLH